MISNIQTLTEIDQDVQAIRILHIKIQHDGWLVATDDLSEQFSIVRRDHQFHIAVAAKAAIYPGRCGESSEFAGQSIHNGRSAVNRQAAVVSCDLFSVVQPQLRTLKTSIAQEASTVWPGNDSEGGCRRTASTVLIRAACRRGIERCRSRSQSWPARRVE